MKHTISNELFLDLVARWNIIDHTYINTKKECSMPATNNYDSFMRELGYRANVSGSLDANFADGLAMFIEWAQDKDFILRPYYNNGNIIFENLDKILKYCCVVARPVINGCAFERVMFTKRVYLQSYNGTKVMLYGYIDGFYPIDVDVTVEKFYNLVNKASLNSHGIPIKDMQEKIDFEKLEEDYSKVGKADYMFNRNKYKYITGGRQKVWSLDFLSSSSGSSSSSDILDMGRKNLGNSGIGFGDYYGEY